MLLNNLFYLCAGNYVDCYGAYANKAYFKGLRDHLTLTQKYVNLHTTRFAYENLPDETKAVTGKNLLFESMLYFAPAVAWFKDNALGLQALPVQGNWKFDIAGYPTEWEVFGANGYRKKLTDQDSVIMFNDYAFTIPFVTNITDIENMLECDRTHRQNLLAQRQPLIAEIEEDEKRSADKFIAQLKGFEDVIKVRVRHNKDKKQVSTNPYELKVFESGRQFQGDKLGADYRYFENRIYTRMGYNNENIEKKERLLVDEVNGNNVVINSFYTDALECRKEAIEKVNKMFGTNIVVKRKEIETLEKESDEDVTVSERETAQRRTDNVEE